MTLASRHMLMAAWIALYGLIALPGPTLHALPGCEHAEDGASGHPDWPPGPSDHCPICQHHLQGQLPVERASIARVDRVERDAPAESAPAPARPATPRANPRAPPAA